MALIRDLFRADRPIDRPIEKVITYDARERLATEVEEYQIERSVERAFQRFLDAYEQSLRGDPQVEVGVWVSGFFGSGKSSFTKYLALALENSQVPDGRRFAELLGQRFTSALGAQLRAVAKRAHAQVFMVDLGTNQLANTPNATVTSILWAQVTRALGFSSNPKLRALELRLDSEGKYKAFQDEFLNATGETWASVHNDPMAGVTEADKLAPQFLPKIFPAVGDFSRQVWVDEPQVVDRAREIIDLVRRYRQSDRIVFVVDEVGQYVAPRSDLILNLDGLVRAFKEEGKGKVWFIATAQQTLTEITRAAAHNSLDLFKLKDRFPLPLELDATDIPAITQKRLLDKSDAGHRLLIEAFAQHGASLANHTHLEGWPLRSELSAETFAGHYPFLPARFELLLELIKALARRTGGVGLRSAIRLVQDVLVDTSRALDRGLKPFADRELGELVSADDLYDSLARDLGKEYPHACEGVEKVRRHPRFADDPLALRAAKAVALLTPLEDRPRSAHNVASLLYGRLGTAPLLDAVEKLLHAMVAEPALGMVEDRGQEATEQAPRLPGGFVFVSEAIRPLQQKRDAYQVINAEQQRALSSALKNAFEGTPPETRLFEARTVRAELRVDRQVLLGEKGDVRMNLLGRRPHELPTQRDQLLRQSAEQAHAHEVFWLWRRDEVLDSHLVELAKSQFIVEESQREEARLGQKEVAQYRRSEQRRADRALEHAVDAVRSALGHGELFFRGMPRAAAELAEPQAGPAAAGAAMLRFAAHRIFERYEDLGKGAVTADAPAKLLDAPQLGKLPKEADPLGFVHTTAGKPRINPAHPALQSALHRFRELATQSGAGRVQGSVVLEQLSEPPFGWPKDATRLVFAGLLIAGEIEVHGHEGVLRTAGPKAKEAFRNTQNFGRLGIALRGAQVTAEALDRASRRLEELLGVEVLPLEDQIARVVRQRLPERLEQLGALPERLVLYGLAGEARARAVVGDLTALIGEDAGGAAALLGAADRSLVDNLRWAEQLKKTLDNTGRDIRQAAAVLTQLGAWAKLSPEARRVEHGDAVRGLRELLKSERFAEYETELHAKLDALARELCTASEDLTRQIAEANARFWAELVERPGARALIAALPPPFPAALDELNPAEPAPGPEEDVSRGAAVEAASARLGERLAAVELRVRAERMARAELAQAAAATAEDEAELDTSEGEAPAWAQRSRITSAAELDAWLGRARLHATGRIARGPAWLRLVVEDDDGL